MLRDGAALGLRDSGPFTDVADLADGTYAYALVAIDAAGNASPPSAATSVVLDRVAPPAPELRGPVDVQGAPALAWDGGGGAVAWELRRDGAVVATRTTRTFDDDAATAEGAYGYTAIAIDAAGNRSAASSPYVVTVDRTPPAAPGAPVAADEIARTSPALGWEAVAGATGYAILRDGVEVGTTAGTAFTDTLVATADVYAYALVALDAAGNRSAASPATSVDFRPGAPDAPAAPTGASPSPRCRRCSGRRSRTSPPTSSCATAPRSARRARRSSPTPARRRTARTAMRSRRARRTAARASRPPPSRSRSMGRRPPCSPTSRRTPRAADGARPRLERRRRRGRLRVTRDGVAVVRLDGAATGSALRWSDADAGEGAHLYGVRALDEAGNAGAPATVAVVVDRTPPGTPSPAAVAAVVQGVPAISWPAVEGAASYGVARDGGAVATVATTAFSDVERDADGLFAYRVAAVDDVGNASAPSAWVLVERDATPPAAAVGLRATSPTAGDVSLAWDAVPGAVRYRVLADGAALVEVAGTSHVATAAEGAHAYAVVAIDLAGNEGPASEPLAVVVDRTAPAAPAALTAAAAVTSGTPTLAWAPVADAVAYRVLRGGAAVATVAAPAYLDQASLADGTYAYAVAAIDAAGNVSASGASVTVRVDGTLPVRPASVVAVSPTRVAPVVRWLPVADAVAYRVERDGVLRATTSKLPFTDDVPADGLYAYRVVALDEAVNASRPSDAVEVAVDTTAPAVPAAPAAETPTRSGPALAWDAIPGASSYAVLRDEVRIGETSDTSFVDVTLVDEGEHGYRLRALDAAGNASAAGPTTTVELDLTAPAAPVVAAASPTRSAPVLTWPAVEGATATRCAATARRSRRSRPAASRTTASRTATTPTG